MPCPIYHIYLEGPENRFASLFCALPYRSYAQDVGAVDITKTQVLSHKDMARMIALLLALAAAHRTLARHLAGHVRGAPFDAIGLSMYPKYDGGATLRSAAALGPLAAAFPAATVYIAETSYPASGAARPQDLVGFPPSPAGQLAYVHALRATLREALPAAQNGGFLWWEETEGADDSLFDAHYVARPALRHGFATPSRRHGEN